MAVIYSNNIWAVCVPSRGTRIPLGLHRLRLLSWNAFHFIQPEQIQAIRPSDSIVLDNTLGDDRLQPQRLLTPAPGQVLIRRVHDYIEQENEAVITPLCKCHPIRGELEIKAYGRDYFKSLGVSSAGRRRVISLPF